MLELWQVGLWRIWNDSLVVELLKVDVFTKWLVQMTHGRLSIYMCVCVGVCVTPGGPVDQDLPMSAGTRVSRDSEWGLR